jgi:hypothetical protein
MLGALLYPQMLFLKMVTLAAKGGSDPQNLPLESVSEYPCKAPAVDS